MVDDDRIEQLAKQKNFLNDELIEQVRQEIRNAADNGEQLSFIDAALRRHLLNDYQASLLKQQADREVSGLETEDISAALPPGIAADRIDLGEYAGEAPPESSPVAGSEGPEGEPIAAAAGEEDAAGEPSGEPPAEGPEPAAEAPATEAAEHTEAPAEAEAAPQELEPAEPVQPQTSPRIAVIIGFALLVIITIIVAILNR
ncbi:MAG TPA: hypothetical protein VNA25_00845 [Phycisphaerae bacterium]|nr:hypothetical protein [Phycisphaerae bacterium]